MSEGAHPVLLITSTIIANVIGWKAIADTMTRHGSDQAEDWKARFKMMMDVCNDVDSQISHDHSERAKFDYYRAQVEAIYNTL